MVSRSAGGSVHVPRTGIRELHILADALERMRLSMMKALAELHRDRGEDGGERSS